MDCDDIPELPPNPIIREKLCKDIMKAFFSLKDKNGWIVVRGGAGSGKTVVANLAVRDEDTVTNNFPAGFFWLKIGKKI